MDVKTHSMGLLHHPGFSPPGYGRYSPGYRDRCTGPVDHSPSNLFGGMDDGILSRAEVFAVASDMQCKISNVGNMSSGGGLLSKSPDSLYNHHHHHHHHHDMLMHNQRVGGAMGGPHSQGMPLHGFGSPAESMLEQLTSSSCIASMPSLTTAITAEPGSMPLPPPQQHMYPSGPPPPAMYGSNTMNCLHAAAAAAAAISSHHGMPPHMQHPQQAQLAPQLQQQHHAPQLQQSGLLALCSPQHPQQQHPQQMQQQQQQQQQQHQYPSELDCDPRELEAFAERFKQRRIKLGVTQADVGSALGNLKLPGVGSLSQSTICRFESLTLSHNNMIALQPVLRSWLDEAERVARDSCASAEGGYGGGSSVGDKKRKRTSIAAPEKRSLEAYFAIQPRPSGEKIAQIAEKLELRKNVVRVWFCNQRQKQKRMKFSAVSMT